MLEKKDIEKRIIQYRTSRGWTQQQFANVLGRCVSTVCKMETGYYNWTPLTLALLEKKLPGIFNKVA